jgi:hypothetical protein
MNHQAIYKAYPKVVKIDDSKGAFDETGNLIKLDEDLIEEALKQLDLEAKAEAKLNAEAKARAEAKLAALGLDSDDLKALGL